MVGPGVGPGSSGVGANANLTGSGTAVSTGTVVGWSPDGVSISAISGLLLARVSGCGVGVSVEVAITGGGAPVERSASPVCVQATISMIAIRLKVPVSRLVCWCMSWLIPGEIERRVLISADSELFRRLLSHRLSSKFRCVQFRLHRVTSACVRAGAGGAISRGEWTVWRIVSCLSRKCCPNRQ